MKNAPLVPSAPLVIVIRFDPAENELAEVENGMPRKKWDAFSGSDDELDKKRRKGNLHRSSDKYPLSYSPASRSRRLTDDEIRWMNEYVL